MTEFKDVIIIGGGAIGAACARELADAGRSVTVLERGPGAGEAWSASAGMLAPQIEAAVEDPLFELGLAGRNRYEELAPVLAEFTGIDIGLWLEGIAHVAHDEPGEDHLRSRVAWQRQQGHVCDWLSGDEVRERWPWLGPTRGALWSPEDGALDPDRLVEALLADAREHGAEVVRDTAVAVESQASRLDAVVGKNDRYAADQIIVAAGAWSGHIEGLPRPISVAPIRGQMAALPWPADVERSIVYGQDGYILARGDEAIIGTTMEYAGFNADVTSAGLAHVFAGATRLCPALATVEVTRTWAGLRPGTPDGIPIVGREPSVDNLWLATGHGRNGILLAAITGLTIAQLMAGEPTTIEDVAKLDPARFWRW